MLTLAEIRKQAEGLAFDVTLDLNDVLKKRNADIISVDDIHAVGLASYDDGLYLLHYQLTYRITLPSSRSMQPVTLAEKEVVDARIKELQSRSDVIKEQILLKMFESSGVSDGAAKVTATCGLWKITLNTQTTKRVDANALKKAGLYDQFTKDSVSKVMRIAKIKD